MVGATIRRDYAQATIQSQEQCVHMTLHRSRSHNLLLQDDGRAASNLLMNFLHFLEKAQVPQAAQRALPSASIGNTEQKI